MENIKFIVEYDGSNFYGWQRQKEKRTVQGEIEKVLSKLLKQEIKIHAAGRTDSGVHSYGQCAHFSCLLLMPIEKLKFALNNQLPKDIYISSMMQVDKNFHSRYSSISKKYLYKINTSNKRDPFTRNYSYQYPYDLDLDRMIKASKYFLGKHDFCGFMASGSNVKTTIREIYSIEINYRKDNIIEIEFFGNGFLYNMVRIMVATLLDAGRGKIEPHEVEEILESKDRDKAKITAPPQGLYLKEVFY